MVPADAKNRSRAAARLIAAERHARKNSYLFTAFQTDGLALRAIALSHAPKAAPAIERAL
jgi:hypothetical protein